MLGVATAQAQAQSAVADVAEEAAEGRWVEQMPEVVTSVSDGSGDKQAFQVLPGFQVERLFEVPKETHGSWVSMAFDDQGRLIVSDQQKLGLFRVTPSPVGSEEPTRVEKLDLPVTSAQGMLFAFDSLYISINGAGENGYYRAVDSDDDGELDQVKPLLIVKGGGEHGPHSIRLGPDGESLYVVAGNHTDPPQKIDATRMLRNWDEDLLLPRQWDARGHARGRMAPGGWIARTNPDGSKWEIVSSGFRNTFDFAFNPDGEMFAYDADMEWDLGMPWYRPTRLLHATSGSEFGWRSGTGKWPAYYVDSLPSVIDIGPGSPTGVEFGTGTRFPAKYQRALYLLDWTFGTIYAVHLRPTGSTYIGDKEEFVSRVALPLTDAAVGPDGALYFAVGGRGTQSALYRVTYVGDEAVELVDGYDAGGAEARALRHQLEMSHPRFDDLQPAADVDLIWSVLNQGDRFLRYAGRVALENQAFDWSEPDNWAARILADPDPIRRIQGAVAIAHAGSQQYAGDDQATQRNEMLLAIVQSLRAVEYDRLTDELRLDLLRAYSLAFIRLGRPSDEVASGVIAQLSPHFPEEREALDRELVNVLVYLNAPGVVHRTLALMQRETAPPEEGMQDLLARNPRYGKTISEMLGNHPEIQKLHYAFALRNVRYGWTLEERKQYFAWLNAAKSHSGGASYEGFIENMRKEALENMSAEEREALASDIIPPPPKPEELPKPAGPGHSWTIDEIVSLAGKELRGRNFENGQRTFSAARCVVCHRFDGRGGATGPDLTGVSGRFSVRDLADAVVQPSRIVSDQYRAMRIETANGQVITGRVIGETEQDLTVQTNPEDANQIATVPKADIAEQAPSPTSLMPEKLLEPLNEDELLDLLAYLLSRGNPSDLMFKAANAATAN
ncbi:MAG: c-type cytochrome [Planctomycetales bacterium]|nr:c-type cytochrome [Planctomycetales bacterium]